MTLFLCPYLLGAPVLRPAVDGLYHLGEERGDRVIDQLLEEAEFRVRVRVRVSVSVRVRVKG